jgi:periplasmic mercuric ion binding protein
MLKRWTIGVLSVMVSAMGLASPAFATSQTVTLSVPGMTCSACPITVKKALQKVPGVENVSATFEPKEAVVTFDDRTITLDQLREATAKAGYPSMLKEKK